MSKRCKLQKEYYKEFGNYKGDGNYSDDYVKWLESKVSALRLYGVVSSFCPCGKVTNIKDCHCPDTDFFDNDLH